MKMISEDFDFNVLCSKLFKLSKQQVLRALCAELEQANERVGYFQINNDRYQLCSAYGYIREIKKAINFLEGRSQSAALECDHDESLQKVIAFFAHDNNVNNFECV